MNVKEFLDSEKSRQPHYLLLGNPIGHSVSPVMHNAALATLHLPGHYMALAVSNSEIPLLSEHFRTSNFLGANVTIPHKESFFDTVDMLTDEAKKISAINTLLKQGDMLIGDNTDAYGFLEPLTKYTARLKNGKAIVFGTGGATKAIIYALRSIPVKEVVMVSRRPENYGSSFGAVVRCGYEEWVKHAEDAAIVINATPLGMHPNMDASPVDDADSSVLKGKICYDIVYNPRKTVFLKQAEQAGGIPIGGLEMLIYQGAKSFKLWTGHDFPIENVRKILEDALPN